MLSENKKILDFLYTKQRLKPFLYFAILALVLAALSYSLIQLQPKLALEQSHNVKSIITAKITGVGASMFRTFCGYQLKNGEIITVRCPSQLFILGSEVKLIRVTKPSGYVYYETADSELNKSSKP